MAKAKTKDAAGGFAHLGETRPDETPPTPPPGSTVATRKAVVSAPGTHVRGVEVTVPADAPDQSGAAVEAAKRKCGILAFGAGPVVTFLD